MTKAEQMIHDYKEKERLTAERYALQSAKKKSYMKYYIGGAVIAIAAIGFGFLLGKVRG